MGRTHQVAESLRIAVDALRANTSRGVLTTLGIIIGIVGVVTTMTAANGLSNSFQESVSVLGSDVLYVSRMPWVIQGNFFEFRNRPNVTLRDVEDLERRMHDAVAVNPTVTTRRGIQYESGVMSNVDVVGTTDRHILVSSALPALGRFFTVLDVQYKNRVCVIGSTVRETLFDRVDPINKEIRIGRHRYRVVGVMEKQGSAGFFGGPDFDSQVLVPITTFLKSFGGTNRDLNVAVKAPAGEALADYEYELIGEMRQIRKLKPSEADDFTINKMDMLVAMFNNVMGVIVAIGIAITGISLFVGGIGVMNVMFVSVTERTREIGIRKAIGARRRSILAQFLFEAMAICLLGGVLGVVLAYGVTRLIDALVLPASVSPGIVAVALGVSLVVGILSGLIPAIRASRLDPIEALRYE